MMMSSRAAHTKEKKSTIEKKSKQSPFNKKISQCPQQVLRYAYGGQPLWSSDDIPEVSARTCPHCPGCNEARVFEMQFMPTLLAYLDRISLKENGEAKENPESVHQILSGMSQMFLLCHKSLRRSRF
jgi:hypothetical protein